MTGDSAGEERITDPRPQHTPLWSLLSRWLLALEAWLRSHGGTRLRAGLWGFWGVVALAGGILLFGPVINPPMTLDDITDSASHATDTWIARDFDVDYTLGRTADGRLEAEVVETIGAFFPDDVDENGIVRVLPTQYQGHALSPSDIAVTLDGGPAAVQRSESADQLTLTLTAPDAARLDGDHEFVVRYRMHDLAYSTTDRLSAGDPIDLLAWDVFGPSWPQAFAALDVTVTLPDDLDAALVRQPRGSISWAIVSAGEWLEPQPGAPPGLVSYGFTNDQNIPPHASARFSLAFQPGTFTMPPPTPLFLLQTFGPLLPLVFLALTLLFALAARAVAWSDARGRPWFTVQYSAPDGVSPRMAAQLLRTPRTLELAGALGEIGTAGAAASAKGGSAKPSRADRLRAAARAANRTGRLGDRIRARLAYLVAPERQGQFRSGFRRVPSGFVRDAFIAAPIALTIMQWGLVRQLSHQAKLAVVWWPAAFVLASSLIALVVLVIALSARPLTRRGALVKQHLTGIAAYADRTSLLERATAGDTVLPYAVLTVEPREAGRRTLALLEAELGDPDAAKGWRAPGFLSTPRILVRILAVALLAATVTAAALLPNPYPRSPDYSANSGDLPGTYFNRVDAFEAAATLTVDGGRHATLTATEHLTVDFGTESTAEVPQFARQWPTRLDGQELGLRVTAVTLDGTDARYTTAREGDSVLLTTAFSRVLSGKHELDIAYTVDSPMVAAPASGASAAAASAAGSSGPVDRLRWVSLLEGWDDASVWRDEPAASPLSISLTVPDGLAPSLAAGWITLDTESSDSVRQWEDSVVPFGAYAATGAAAAPSGTTDEVTNSAGTTTYRLDLRSDGDGGYPFDLTVDDVGAMLDFPAGTVAGPDAAALTLHTVAGALPLALTVTLGSLALALGLLGVAAAVRRRSRRAPPGLLRDVIWWLGTSAAVSTVWLFVWATSDMPDDWPEFPPLGLSALAAFAGGILCLTVTLRQRPPTAGATKRR